MNPRKRPAEEPLLPLHSAKQCRIEMVDHDGYNHNPSRNPDLLSRWKHFGREFTLLAVETAKALINGIRHTQVEQSKLPLLPSENDQPSRDFNTPTANDMLEPDRSSHPSPGSTNNTESRNDHNTPSHPGSDPTPPRSSTQRTEKLSQMGPPSVPFIHDSHIQLEASSSRQKQKNGVILRRYRNREHIYAKAHKANVRAETQKTREEIQRQIYAIQRNRGYTSNFTDFQSLLAFQAKLEKLDQREAFSPSSSMVNLRTTETEDSPRRHSYSDADDMEFLRRAFYHAKATLNEPPPPQPFQPSLDQLRLSHRLQDQHIEHLLRPKLTSPTPLSPREDAQVDIILKKRGVVSKFAREQVSDQDISRLKPSQWLNDELINFYGAMILGRSDDSKENPPKNETKGVRLMNVYYLSTFFWPKLKEGYEKGRLAKWTKKVDIFAKDLVLIPINHSNAHWTGAAINFRRKRIESYDSMGTRRDIVFKLLRSYLDAEHRNKKKKPFDFNGWEDYSLEEPLQENGYDCGVFTCQFLQGLSRGDEYIRFTQKDMSHLRRRMIWEIGNATLREEP